jgi:hypothetical protein
MFNAHSSLPKVIKIVGRGLPPNSLSFGFRPRRGLLAFSLPFNHFGDSNEMNLNAMPALKTLDKFAKTNFD